MKGTVYRISTFFMKINTTPKKLHSCFIGNLKASGGMRGEERQTARIAPGLWPFTMGKDDNQKKNRGPIDKYVTGELKGSYLLSVVTWFLITPFESLYLQL